MLAYVCDCPTNKYWNGANCVSRVGNGVACTTGQDYNCYFGSGMTCVNNKCKCADPNTYWDGSICRTYQTYYDSCASYQCNPNYGLICSSSNACVCPYNTGTNYCDCPSNKYWNGARCTQRSTYNGPCPTLQNYNCLTSQNLICSGGYCVCPSWYAWDSFSSSCYFIFG